MSPHFWKFLLAIFIWAQLQPKALAKKPHLSCEVNREEHVVSRTGIGVVIDLNSRIGKEQKIAMEMALEDSVHDFSCFKLELHFQDASGNSARKASHVLELLNNKKAEAIIGDLTLQEAAIVWEFSEASKNIPIISLIPTSASTLILPQEPQPPHSFITMSYNIELKMQCIAAIVGHFKWQKVIAIYEHSNDFSQDSALLTHLADSLRPFGSVLEHHFAFPNLKKLSEPEKYIEEKLMKLRSMNITVFSVMHCSLDFAMVLFKKAKEMGMMDKGYVWIISDDIANFIDSIDSSIIVNYMQGVIGFKENVGDLTGTSLKSFELRFSRKYREHYPEEYKHSFPSIHALKAYDATMVTTRAMLNENDKSYHDLIKCILGSKFKGLSGNISFMNGSLVRKPVFHIVNLIGRSYREVGFLEEINLNEHVVTKIKNGVRLDSIYWPGGETNVPKGWMLSDVEEEEEPMRIGVPAMGAFKQFVNVTYDPYTKQTTITGFSIDVFDAAVKRLPYHLPYVLVPFYGSYDQLVEQVHNKTFDGAVGDTTILAGRFKITDFTHPYMDTSLVTVVTVKPDIKKSGISLLNAFTWQMWLLMASMTTLTGFVVWFNEYVHENPEFSDPFPQNIGSMFWFSVTVLSFNQREDIHDNLSRLVLSTWLFVTVIVTSCFTGAINSIITIPKLEASIDIDSLLGTGVAVGCNRNSFIAPYLTDVIGFKPENIKIFSSINDYPNAFQTGDIKAAFFVGPHARIFLAQHCNGYKMDGPTYRFGGFGFAFQKGSNVTADISEAILQLIESRTINQLEKRMLSSFECSSSSEGADGVGPVLGLDPFFYLFIVAGGLLAITFLKSMWRLVVNHWPSYGWIQAFLMSRGIYRWILIIYLRKPIIETPNNRFNGNGNELVRV